MERGHDNEVTTAVAVDHRSMTVGVLASQPSLGLDRRVVEIFFTHLSAIFSYFPWEDHLHIAWRTSEPSIVFARKAISI